LSLSVVALALIEPFAAWLETTQRLNPFDEGGRAGGLSILMLLTMAFAGPLGFAYAMVNAPAQTTLHERAPADMRGRVFASQVVLANAVGILPLIVAGSVADILGVTLVLFMIAAALATVAAVSIYLEAKWSTGERPAPPLTGVV
jgi:sugar phosphate permease